MQRGKDCQPGDKVRLLHEKGEGVVVRKTIEFVYVDLGDGFELPVLYDELIIMEKAKRQAIEQKNEQISTIQPQTLPEKKTQQTAPRQIPKMKDEPVRGMYLAFAPVNQQVLLAGDLRIYLVNYTKLKAHFVLFTQSGEKPSEAYSGIAEPASALLIDTIDRKDAGKFRKGMFQCVFPVSTMKGIILPVYSHIEIKPERFLNEEMYTENYALSMFALTVQLLRLDELRYASLSMGKSSVDEGHGGIQSMILKKENLIDKYRIALGEAEVDLHIETITGKQHVGNDMQKLKKQLDIFTQCLESAIANGYTKVIFIHGVGVGVLKMEIQNILRTYDMINFRDAPIAQYGIGATEVIIRKK
jgi:hypothetical protein